MEDSEVMVYVELIPTKSLSSLSKVVVQVAMPETPSGPQFMVPLMPPSDSNPSLFCRSMTVQGPYNSVTSSSEVEAAPVP